MYLLVDIGNTRDKAAVYNNNVITPLMPLTAAALYGLNFESVLFANVAAEERVASLRNRLSLHHLRWQVINSEPVAFGVKNGYQDPSLIGVDRWLGLVGARACYPEQKLIIIDAGTAVTIDLLLPDGLHAGGWILPGLALQQQAVVKNTAKVVTDSVFNAKLSFGNNTVSCLQNGCLAAVVGAINMAQQLHPDAHLVLTGGDAQYLQLLLAKCVVHYEPLLIFKGIACYIDR